MKKFTCIIALISITICYGQQLTYKPISPFFGGETFNYQMILASAQAQNDHKEPQKDNMQKSSQQSFEERIKNQVMNQLSKELFDEQFSDGMKEGVFNIGSMSIEIFETSEGMVINMLNTRTGEYTQITMPNN